MQRKHAAIIILAIILLASAVRLYDPLFRSLWGDEAHSLYSALGLFKAGFWGGVSSITADSHLPAYFLLLSVWIKIFSLSEYSLRFLSIIVGIVSVLVFYLLSREMFDEKASLISAFLLAISPLAVMHSQEIRMYGLLLLFTILSSYYYWKLLSDDKSRKTTAGYLISTALLLLTHIYAVLLLLSQIVFTVYDTYKTKNVKRCRHLLLLQCIPALIALPLYAHIVLSGLSAVLTGAGDMAFSNIPSYLKLFLYFFVLSLGETVAPWNIIIVLPAALVFGYLILKSMTGIKDGRIKYLFLMCFFPVVLSAFFLRPTMPKYLIISLPFYLMLIGSSLGQIRSIAVRASLIACLAFFQIFSIYNYFNLREFHNSNQIEPWREVASLIREKYQKGDSTVSSNPYIVTKLLNYYLNLSEKGHYQIRTLDVELKSARSITGRRIWLVTHILDDRVFRAGYLQSLRSDLLKRYDLVLDKRYIPYEETLGSKLPTKRHKAGSERIRVSLFSRKLEK